MSIGHLTVRTITAMMIAGIVSQQPAQALKFVQPGKFSTRVLDDPYQRLENDTANAAKLVNTADQAAHQYLAMAQLPAWRSQWARVWVPVSEAIQAHDAYERALVAQLNYLIRISPGLTDQDVVVARTAEAQIYDARLDNQTQSTAQFERLLSNTPAACCRAGP
jgi:hypothetical protein